MFTHVNGLYRIKQLTTNYNSLLFISLRHVVPHQVPSSSMGIPSPILIIWYYLSSSETEPVTYRTATYATVPQRTP